MKPIYHNGLMTTEVLLADDDADDQDLFEEAVSLISRNIRITTADNGEDLMSVLTRGHYRPDIIFLDLNMPRKNGKECLAEIRKHEDLQEIPVIIYSTSLNPVDIEDTYKNGARYFFRKPNSFEELKQTLQRLIESNMHVHPVRERDKYILNPT